MSADRTFVGECRAEGREIRGLGLPYGEVSPTHRERFLAGGGSVSEHVLLDLDHDRLRAVAWRGAGLDVVDDARGLMVRATAPHTPAGDAALAGIASGERSGLSVEFRALKERREPQTGVRLVEQYIVAGFGLVAKPSYPSAKVLEVRQLGGAPIRGRVSLGEDLPCRCRSGCESIRFETDSLDAALAEAASGARVIPAFFSGSFEAPIATRGNGLTVTRRGRALDVTLDGLPETEAANAFRESLSTGTAFTWRPYVPVEPGVEIVKDGTTALIEAGADLRGIELAPISGPVGALQAVTMGRQTRRRRLWL